MTDEDKIKSILFAMHFENNSILQDKEIAVMLKNYIYQCAQQWNALSQIKGVISKECWLMLDGFNSADKWCYK